MNETEQNNIKLEIGRFLKSIRVSKNKTAKQLGDKTGYSQSHISGIENGKKTMPSKQFIESYLMYLKDNSEEFNYYADKINSISKGQIQLNKIVEFDSKKFFDSLNAMAVPYQFNFYDHNDEKQVSIFQVPINDIHFHLSDINNLKFYKTIKVTEKDKKNIEELIDLYFKNKANIIREIRNEFVQKDTSINELEKTFSEIENKLNKE